MKKKHNGRINNNRIRKNKQRKRKNTMKDQLGMEQWEYHSTFRTRGKRKRLLLA